MLYVRRFVQPFVLPAITLSMNMVQLAGTELIRKGAIKKVLTARVYAI